MIAPSDEDSFTFTVSAANGDIFKLRGKYVPVCGTLNHLGYIFYHIYFTYAVIFFIIFVTTNTCPSA